ncbi:hypothetical protein LMG24238_00068 [Paraburkholderia sediminicola]|uniref:Uncharacterized protein n=1 Tax=Paraburkholderia sediminicola TaxID=458836 RepID=A0A6J4ZUB8_9BURK|nr:hypothetical protein [Paraburkholderia sediminicola]CAB3638569.1 hypothetical protein LMG24238_00068 [Paraburkholderia sediminicola]
MTHTQSATNAAQSSSLMTAFPAALRPEVSVVADLIQGSNATHPGLPVVVRGESLNIPYRIHHDSDEMLFARLNETQAIVYACVLTRHHDGHMRQRQIGRLVTLTEPWVAPFVMQLCGEYVIEILDAIEAHLPSMHQRSYGAFFRENPLFFQRTQDRMISYWDCYYRWLYKRKLDYVGFRLFGRFREWSAAV